MAHLELHQTKYRLIYKLEGKRRRIPLGTDDWYWAVARAHHLHHITLDGRSAAEVFFQILPVLEEQVAVTTLETYRIHWQKLANRFGRTDVSQITPTTLAGWKKELMENYSETTVRMTLNSIQAVFSVLKRLQVVKASPFDTLKNFLPKAKLRTEYLKPNECLKLIEAANRDPLAQLYIKLLLATGIRRGELYNLKWSDINEHIALRGKTGERRFPLWSHVRQILNEIRKLQPLGAEYVLTTKDFDHPFEPNYIGNMVSKYAKKAGFKGISTHALRHTFGTNMVPRVGIRAVQKLMGHSRIETTCRYENASVLDIEEIKYF
jgi:integrase